MKEELIIKILAKSSKHLSQAQLKQLRYILDEELYSYNITSNCTDLVPVNDLNENIALYLADKKYIQELSMNTIESYFRILNKFAKTIYKNIDQIDVMDMRKYVALISQSGLKKTSVSTHIWTLKTFFQWLVENEKIKKNPMKTIKPPKCEKRLRKPLSSTELETIRYKCKNIRELALIDTFFSLGGRLSEISNLNISDIDWNTGRVLVIGKGDKERPVYLNSRARLYLKEYIKTRKDKNDALFVSERMPYDRLGKRGIQRIFHNLGVRADLNRNLFPHLLRSTCGNELLKKNASLHDVQHYLGHSSPATTDAHYVEVNQESIRLNCQRCLN